MLLAGSTVALAQPPAESASDRPSESADPEPTSDVETSDVARETTETTDVDTTETPDTVETASDETTSAETSADEFENQRSDDYDDEDEEGAPSDVRVRYFLERVEIRGNTRTRGRVIRSYVPVQVGEVIDPEADLFGEIEWQLRSTGWFNRVELSIEPGARYGWVVLVVRVEERNTVQLSGLTLGVGEGLNRTVDPNADLVPYVGATLTDTNFVGTGAQLSLSFLGSVRAYGFLLDYNHPRLFPRNWALRVAPFFYKARQFFGNDPLIAFTCPPGITGCAEEVEAKNAVVFYQRGGVILGTGTSLGSSTRLHVDYHLDVVDRRAAPDAASERRGAGPPVPIDFAIQRGVSYVSRFNVGLTFDRRNDPVMTSRGVFVRFDTDLASRALGSDYDFLRAQLLFRGWIPLPRGQSLRLGLFAGAIFGSPPFFLLFHIADLSDLIPSRVMEMQLDRRAGLLNTSIEIMRAEEIAARFDIQYEIPLYRSRGRIRGLNAYFNIGVYTLLDPDDVTIALEGFDGASRVPIDLTFDVGLRFDSRVGVFQFGFSNILGLVGL